MGRMTIIVAIMVGLGMFTKPAMTQSFPNKPIRVIVPYGPGGSPDVSARIIATPLQQLLQQAIVVENRPGANGTIGARAVAMAPPDGYTLLLANSTFATNSSSRKSLPYDALADFVPVAGIGRSAGSLMVVSTKTSI